jgi:hypothetical protein
MGLAPLSSLIVTVAGSVSTTPSLTSKAKPSVPIEVESGAWQSSHACPSWAHNYPRRGLRLKTKDRV